MISKQADFFQGEVPEVIKDLIWDDEKGFFENSLRWGGRGLMLVSGPLAILNVAAGMMGIGLADVGRMLDEKLAGKDLSNINPSELAGQMADEMYPELEARAEVLRSGRVVLAAEPAKQPAGTPKSKITFEAAQPTTNVKTKAPAPVEFEAAQPAGGPKARAPAPIELPGGEILPPWTQRQKQPFADKPTESPAASKSVPLAQERAKMEIRDEFDRRKHLRRREYAGLTFDQQLKLREIDQAEAASAHERKKDLDRHHAEMEHGKFLRDRESMEHQIRTKYEIEDRYLKEKQKFDLQRELVMGKITPEQHRLMVAAISGTPMSYDELERAKKNMSRAEREELKKRLDMRNAEHRQTLKHRADFQKQELRQARLMAAARGGDAGLISMFKGKVGKLGLAAALAAVIFAGFKAMKGGGASRATAPSAPSAQYTSPPATQYNSPRARGKTPSSNKRSRSMSQHINTELKSILGD
jgi:hypothetical protein